MHADFETAVRQATQTRFEIERAELQKNVDAWKEAGVEFIEIEGQKTSVAEYEALKREQIAADEAAQKRADALDLMEFEVGLGRESQENFQALLQKQLGEVRKNYAERKEEAQKLEKALADVTRRITKEEMVQLAQQQQEAREAFNQQVHDGQRGLLEFADLLVVQREEWKKLGEKGEKAIEGINDEIQMLIRVWKEWSKPKSIQHKIRLLLSGDTSRLQDAVDLATYSLGRFIDAMGMLDVETGRAFRALIPVGTALVDLQHAYRSLENAQEARNNAVSVEAKAAADAAAATSKAAISVSKLQLAALGLDFGLRILGWFLDKTDEAARRQEELAQAEQEAAENAARAAEAIKGFSYELGKYTRGETERVRDALQGYAERIEMALRLEGMDMPGVGKYPPVEKVYDIGEVMREVETELTRLGVTALEGVDLTTRAGIMAFMDFFDMLGDMLERGAVRATEASRLTEAELRRRTDRLRVLQEGMVTGAQTSAAAGAEPGRSQVYRSAASISETQANRIYGVLETIRAVLYHRTNEYLKVVAQHAETQTPILSRMLERLGGTVAGIVMQTPMPKDLREGGPVPIEMTGEVGDKLDEQTGALVNALGTVDAHLVDIVGQLDRIVDEIGQVGRYGRDRFDVRAAGCRAGADKDRESVRD